MTGSFVVEPLSPRHDRTTFTCGVDALDRYFRRQAGQDVRRRATACFVCRETATGQVAGYYTLAAGGVLLADLPASLAKRLPRYPSVPVARLGRLAVALPYRGRKLGGALLWDAVERAARSEVAVYALVVDAKDEQAERFYRHHGFVAFGGPPGTLILPLRPRTRYTPGG
jgi:GNAT superfamily N-acetyltransferase